MDDQYRRKPRTSGKPVEYFLGLQYPFQAIVDPDDGGYVVVFPDLPGCATQTETIEEIPEMAEEARTLWIETEYEEGGEIPLPTYPEEYSGKFNVRLPRSLHRELAESAEREGVSLNQHVVALLSAGDTTARIERKLDALAERPGASRARTTKVADDRATYTATRATKTATKPSRRAATKRTPARASKGTKKR